MTRRFANDWPIVAKRFSSSECRGSGTVAASDRHKTVDASSNVTPCFLTFQWRRLSAVRCNRLLDCPRLAAARWLARLGIADTTERRSLFTASEVRNTDATSGSRTTATDAVPNCEANLFGLAFE